ncbi:hypothetical protein GMDG_08733 [Pseudogymnoascus destructans 20631-21]|uniref:ARS-binding protein 1 N-terminal domain-containing protein n=1 Tax=Pseudogymnoascus destructans (strain ATCC MYA-4855 / 20631-21) TaxID=658429 RepID=L8GBK2_PSED2|nr:hypothetical protein GMDG_08733 [Pseudogymnoascus destructans 20631-21]
MPRKRPITVDQQRALRHWAHQQVPKPTQWQCIECNFEALDKNQDTGIQRRQLGQWPKLENILWEWESD